MDCSGDNIRMLNVEVMIKAFRLFWIAAFCPRIPTKFGEQLRTTSCSSPSRLSSKIKLCSKTFTQIPRPRSLCLTELNLSINYPAKGKTKQTNSVSTLACSFDYVLHKYFDILDKNVKEKIKQDGILNQEKRKSVLFRWR